MSIISNFTSKVTAILTTLACFFIANGKTSKTTQPEIMVFAAAGIVDVITDINAAFKVKYPIDIKTNLGSSGTLARQIAQGGNPDIFISASKVWMKYVDSLGYAQKDAISEIAKNEIVIIAPVNSILKEFTVDSTLDFVSLLNSGRLSIGDPAHVPAGQYAKEALEFFGWYSSLIPKLLPATDVRSALMVVELGEAPLGIVYSTDAIKSTKVKTVAKFPQKSYQPVVFMACVCNKSEAGYNFFKFLNSEEANSIWIKYGFKK